EQAQALFKHWFVDFAPFKNGNFVESELGMIPEGWRICNFSEIADLHKPSIKPQENIEYSHYSIPAFDNDLFPSHDLGKSIKSNKFVISDSVVLLSKLNPDHKRIWYVNTVAKKSICSTEFLPFYGKNNKNSAFIYCFLTNEHNYREIANGAKGTTNSHQRIDAHDVLSKPFAYNKNVMEDFCVIVEELFHLKNMALLENKNLSTLRDALLPKLMSGQIKI
ncbi:MAG: restriction endonuclease subunit S, partial [Bacteroidales bacterium]|nr:restriction endonuclease subunit S [Bacteroidales bacterium]